VSLVHDQPAEILCPQCGEPQPPFARFCGSCRYQFAQSASSVSEFREDHFTAGHIGDAADHPAPKTPRLIRPAAPARLDGLGNSPRSVVATVVFVWLFNVPLAILYSVVGVVAGGLIGAFGGASVLTDLPVIGDYMDVFAVQVGGVFGALAGATIGLIVGALAGLLAPLLLLGGGDPITILITILGQILVGVIVGGLYTVYAVNCEGMRLRTRGIRRPSRREAVLLQPLLESCAASLHMAETPRLLISDDRSPNASAWTRHIVINAGLMEQFQYDPEPVSAVICHELVHWNSGDAIAQTFLHGVALPLYISYSVLTAIPRVVKHSFVRVLVWLCAWPIMIASRFVIIPLQAVDARRNEYRADLGALLAGRSVGLRQVLTMFKQSFDGNRNGWDEAICASHPPTELRLERMELPGQVYELPDKEFGGHSAHHGVQAGSSVDRDW